MAMAEPGRLEHAVQEPDIQDLVGVYLKMLIQSSCGHSPPNKSMS